MAKKLSNKNQALLALVAAAAIGVFLYTRKKNKIAGIGKMPLSPYQIKWIVLIPERGKATQSDLHRLGKAPFYFVRLSDRVFVRHCSNQAKADEVVAELSSLELGKNYTAYIISDKQFGIMPTPTEEGVLSVMTTLQKNNAVTI